jgi:hypothetical protein
MWPFIPYESSVRIRRVFRSQVVHKTGKQKWVVPAVDLPGVRDILPKYFIVRHRLLEDNRVEPSGIRVVREGMELVYSVVLMRSVE